MNTISDYTKCANCGACYNACPVDAITVESDMFYRVKVNEEICVQCGLCKTVCPVNRPEKKQELIGAYSAVLSNEAVVKKSSSGGFFSAISEYVLAQNGVVWGAVFGDHFQEVKIESTETHDLDDLRRSKYVESKVAFSFRNVKKQLEDGKLVLYCGAPCQIAGLKSYLKKEYENLITCDFSCGGMPSHAIYGEYLAHIQKKLKAPIEEVNFRPKTYGWQFHAIKIRATNNKTYSKLAIEDPYFDCFLGNHSSVRDYCLSCEFADNHYADIIMADFWKYKSVSSVDNRNKGLSLVITNSQKGEMLLQAMSKTMALTVLDLEKASYNMKKRMPTEGQLDTRRAFLESCKKNGFVSAISSRRYKGVFRFKMKYLIKKILRKV